jgi:hypothetical protein
MHRRAGLVRSTWGTASESTGMEAISGPSLWVFLLVLCCLEAQKCYCYYRTINWLYIYEHAHNQITRVEGHSKKESGR